MIKGKCSEMTQQMSTKCRNYTNEASGSSGAENYNKWNENLTTTIQRQIQVGKMENQQTWSQDNENYQT